MPITRSAVRLAVLTCVLSAAAALAQDYPIKAIRVITAEPGGSTDFSARLIAQALSASLGQQVVVENRGGASGALAGEAVAKAAPDGYTLLAFGPAIWLLPFLRSSVPYDPLRDFAPITMTDKSPTLVVVHPSVPVHSIKELIAYAKMRPGKLNYARGGAGGSNHLGPELFNVMAGVNIVAVPYKGGGPAVIGVLSGETQVMFASSSAVTQHVKSGRLRALAITSAEPSAAFPGMPTVAESGLPGFESGTTNGMFAPAATPPAIINRLNQEVTRFLNQPEVKAQFTAVGTDAIASTPAQFGAIVKSEMTKWGKLIKDVGIHDE